MVLALNERRVLKTFKTAEAANKERAPKGQLSDKLYKKLSCGWHLTA